jgi:hypothetical protein
MKKLKEKIKNHFKKQIFLRIILNLILTKASKNQWYLNIGSYLMKKGNPYLVGQIIDKTTMNKKRTKVTYISGFVYDFEKNKIIHKTGNKVINL